MIGMHMKDVRRKLERFVKGVLYWKWVAHCRLCRNVSLPVPEKVTIILPAYQRARLKNIETLVRSALCCDFVEKVVVTNDNTDVRISDWVRIPDSRLVLIDQPVRKGCDHRWEVARGCEAEYYITIDDDVLIYPRQLARLFLHLVEKPEIPHGLAGGTLPHTFYRSREVEVDHLFEVYAFTATHLKVYFDYLHRIQSQGYATDIALEFWGGYLILSHAGTGRPRIHDVGFVLPCTTAYDKGIATFRESEFLARNYEVLNAIKKACPVPVDSPGA
jgi:glycosyltransferase involved in cell wall biosynthesis